LRADRLYVALAPESVALVRVRGLFRPKLVSKTVLACDPQFGAQPWEGAVEALQRALAELAGEPLRATVVLSNRFMRYAVVPFDAKLSGADEELAHARFHFAKIHGERAKGWDLRLSDAPRGASRLASAADGGLAEAIGKCFPRARRPRLVSIQPYLMAAFNRWRRALAKEPAWLVLVEHGRACLALASKEGWRAVQSLRVEEAQEWPPLIERERLRANAAVPLRALVHGMQEGAAHAGWKISPLALPRLDGHPPLEDARFAMALCAQ
jgi:hypothetical protein